VAVKPYPFKIGDHVTGQRGIDATVVALPGPYSVVLSDGHFTPISLLNIPDDEPPQSMEDMLA
jgi:hypothetical protein